MNDLTTEISQKQSELQTMLPEYQQTRDQEERLSARVKACEQRRSELFAKQGRVQQFDNEAQRDRWINKEIASLQQSSAHKEEQVRITSYYTVKSFRSQYMCMYFCY